MSKQSLAVLYRMLSGFIALCLLSADLAGAAALVDFQSAEPIGTPVVVPPAEEQALFRVTVALRQPRDLSRARELGAVVLSADEASALLLVTAPQLADLARLRFAPTAADELGVLLAANGASGLLAELGPVLERSSVASRQWSAASRQLSVASGQLAADGTTDDERQAAETAAAELAGLLAGITPAQQAAITPLALADGDNDGLTDTEEGWWCTNAAVANSDGTGGNDGAEVAALLNFTLSRAVRWGHGAPFGPPNPWPDFNNRDNNPNTPACNDGDYDTIPDFAEAYMVGSRVPEETTDLDKFDDGQELFGTTFCPGGATSCDYGSYPRIEYWNHIKASMPSWVQPPGDNLFVAAFPVPEVSVVAGSWTIERVTTITTAEGTMTETSNSYATTVTEGQGSSVADTRTWNNWQEVSKAVEKPTNARLALSTEMVGPFTPCSIEDWWCQTKGLAKASFAEITYSGLNIVCSTTKAGCLTKSATEPILKAIYAEGWNEATPVDSMQLDSDFNLKSARTASGVGSTGANSSAVMLERGFDTQTFTQSLNGLQLAVDKQGRLVSNALYDVSYQLSRPRVTETKTNGRSWGGAQTTTHEQYEEHAITNGQQFTTGQNWSTAWAVNSAYAADLRFTFRVDNTGTEYFRELTGIVFSIYLGDDETPLISYEASQQIGPLTNFFPADPPVDRTTTPIHLTLEQMKRIDLGEKLTIVVEDFSYGADENFYQDAINGGVEVLIEDGAADNDETVDRYVVPTWGVESVQDVLTRAFPATEDAQGNLIALKTAEFNGTQPPVWNEYALSDIAWWNVYQSCSSDCANVGATPLQEQMAQAGSSILFRFNRDSDRDGYKDNVEWRYGTDRNDPASHPFPEMLAGYTLTRSGNTVTGLLKLQNNGTFDAYGIDAVIYAPDSSITITNNTVGGNGRVRAGDSVAVGALVQPPATANWGNSTAKVYAHGNYTGAADRVYTFTVQNAGVVGAGNTTMTWSDGAGGSGVLQLGSAYHAPLPLSVAHGLEVGLDSGTLAAGARFTVQTLTPRDTFQFTVSGDDYTPPVVVVSYSDPQGSHRFVTPVQLDSLEDDLNAHSGRMLPDIGLSISANGPFQPGGNTTDFILYSPHATPISGAKLYLDFVSDGALVKEYVQTFDQPPGPTVRSATWSAADFNNDYHPNGDNILLAFWTDAQDNIIDSAARPFDTLQDDPTAVLVLDAADLTWNFGVVGKGTIVKKSITVANTGRATLYLRPLPLAGLSMSPTSLAVEPGNFATVELSLDTLALPVGGYNTPIVLRTSDPAQPSVQVNVSGAVNTTANGVVAFSDDPYRPWDRVVRFANAQAAGVATPFTHAITTDGNRVTPLFYQDAAGTRLGDGRDIAEWAGTTTELVQNGGFETGTTAGWASASGAWATVNNGAYQGAYSAQPTQQNNQNPLLYQDIDLANWRTWIEQGYGRATWSNWVNSGGQAGSFQIAFFRPDGSEIISEESGWISTPNSWQEYSSTVFIPAGAAKGQVRLTAQPSTGDTGNIVLIGPSNNGGFEYGNMTYWYTDGTQYDIGTSRPRTGTYHVQGTTGGNYHTFWRDATIPSQYIPLVDSGYGQVNFSIWLNIGQSENHRVELLYLMNNGSWVTGYDTGHTSFGQGWYYFERAYSGVLPVGVRTIRVRVWTKRSDGDYTDVNVDDALLTVRFSGYPVPSHTYFDDISFKLAPQYAAETKPDDGTATILTSPDAIAAGNSRRIQYGLKQQYAAAGEQTFVVRLPDHAYSSVMFDALLRDAAGNPANTTIAVDVGANGSVDWQADGLPVFPTALTTGNLAAAVSAYMAAQPSGADGMVDVPLKVTLGNGGTLFLTNLRATRGAGADGAIANTDVSLSQTNLTEGDTTTINATVRSAGPSPLEDVTVAFFASLPNGFDWYLGSRYLPSVSPSGTQTSLVWDTTGFTGASTVEVVIDPYGTLPETNENNNSGARNATIKTRPNLRPTAITPATFAPVAGEALTVNVTFQNNGQSPSAAAACALYLGNPDDGGTLIGSQACGPLGANTAVTLTYPWTPTAAGLARLFARADSGGVLAEPDEFDNDRWLDLEVGVGAPNTPPTAPTGPNPANGAANVPANSQVCWTASGDADSDPVTYDVAFGASNPPAAATTGQSATCYDPPGDLTANTTYTWRVTAKDNRGGNTPGTLWTFTTATPPTNGAPNPPANPSPANGATGVALTAGLSWSGSDPENDPLTYEVRFGAANPPPTAVGSQSVAAYDPPGNMAAHTAYYWQIVAKDATHPGGTPSPVWSFTTANTAPTAPSGPNLANGATGVPVTTQVCWTASTDPDSDAVTYDVAFGTSNPPTTVVSSSQSGVCYDPPGDLTASTAYYWKVTAKDAFGGSTPGPVWSFVVTSTATTWTPATIGAGSGSVVESGGQVAVTGGGGDIFGTCDVFQYAYQSGSGDMEFIARVSNWNPGSNAKGKGGLMFRASTGACAPHVLIHVTTGGSAPQGVKEKVRFVTNGNTSGANGSGDMPPVWLKLRKVGTLITSYYSTNGVTWTQVGTGRTLDLGAAFLVGFAVSSDSGATATFDNITVTPLTSNDPPTAPGNPAPSHQATAIPTNTQVCWTASTDSNGDAVTYDVAFGTANPPTTVVSTGQNGTCYTPGALADLTTYYWKVTARDATSSTPGPVWSFTTAGVIGFPNIFYLSVAANTTVPGLGPVQAADIVCYTKSANAWAMVFDGSDHGLTKNVSAFTFLDDGSLLFVLGANQTVAGLGTVTPYDVVRFTPSAPGVFPLGAGAFSWQFRGRDHFLTTAGEKIDAIDLDGNRLLLSTGGAASVTRPTGGALKAADEDVFVFNLATNAYEGALLIDGSKMPGMAVEDISGLWDDPQSADFYVTIIGAFNLGGVKGNDKSIVRLTPNGGTSVYTPSLVTWLAAGATLPTGFKSDGIEMAR